MDWQLTETRHQGRHINGQTLVINFKNSKIRRITMHFPQKFTFFQHLSHNSSWNPIFYVRWSGFFMIDERYVFSCRTKKKANFFLPVNTEQVSREQTFTERAVDPIIMIHWQRKWCVSFSVKKCNDLILLWQKNDLFLWPFFRRKKIAF